MGVILESVIKSVVLKFEGRSKNIANKNINPLDKPNKIPKNLSKPDALDQITILLMSFIKSLPKILKKWPQLQVEIAGIDTVNYGGKVPREGSWKKWALKLLQYHKLNQSI